MKQRSGSPEKHRSPAGGCREARPDYGSEHGCRPPGTSHLQDETVHGSGALYKGRVQGNFRWLPHHLSAWTQFEANRKPYFSHVLKIGQSGLILCDNYNASSNLRRCILYRNIPLQIIWPRCWNAVRKCIICSTWPREIFVGFIYFLVKPRRRISCCGTEWDYNGQIVLSLTCFSPDGQIFILLDIQHDL